MIDHQKHDVYRRVFSILKGRNAFPLCTKVALILLLLLGCSPQVMESQAQEKKPLQNSQSVSLHMAALQGNIEAVQQHIKERSDLNAKDAYGSTPLLVATTFGKTEVVKALIEAGSDLEIRDNYGSTPLHVAALLCRTEIVQALLNNGADKYIRSNSGATAFDIVAAPFDMDLDLYDQLQTGLSPMGLVLDYEQMRITRPQLEEILRPRNEDLKAVKYAALSSDNWKISTPGDQGLDPLLVAELYLDAARLENLYGLLLIKNGRLIAEDYFHDRSADQRSLTQSVSKSYISALVGIALEQGCLTSLDQQMMDFFPEFVDRITDPRKDQITIRDLLQMRAGYPWEETDTSLWKVFIAGDHLSLLVDFPLISDPGAGFNYSNLTSYLLGVIVSRACDTDLKSYAEEHLCSQIESEVGDWWQDQHTFYYSLFGFTPREMGKLGLLYLNDGVYKGNQVVPSDWVQQSLQGYSNAWVIEEGQNFVGRYFRELGYGYQWWSAKVGGHRFDFAWGHGGQLIILLKELDMVIVVSSNPFHLQHDDEAWKHEQSSINLIGKFIKMLLKEHQGR
ncbi:MAG: serine hydrolase [Saprospiraceae bacterium]|nr:serine hydrolase [Saprospiraceae bacterium]